MQKLKMHSADLTAQNIEKIAALFPNCLTEREVNGKLEQAIDFDLLKQELSATIVEGNQERYQLNWVGKANATVLANAPINKTLRPCREESVNFDTTQNLFIEGDNLEALKLLQETYLGKVKMIYIDPPYNTGKDFIYKDNFAMANEDYQRESGQVDEEGNRLVVNSESNGRFHSDWLSMIYSRLKLARNLLTDDGVIFISIDESEFNNLKSICNEVFGSQNMIGIFIWQNKKGGGNDARFLATEHEYIMMFSKSLNNIPKLFEKYDEDYLKRYKEKDDYGLFFWDTFKRKSGKQYYSIECPDGTSLEFDNLGNPISWLRSKDRFLLDKENGEIKFVKTNDGWTVMFKQRLPEGKKPRSLLLEKGTTSNGSEEILSMFNKHLFDNPKPLSLIKYLADIILRESDLILDFFAGSATTAHAVMQLNAEDGGNRKFIMVQIPEQTDEKSEAHKAGYHTIAEISKERIRRAGQKIKQEKPDAVDLDIGFRVLKIDSSNMADIYYNPQQIEQGDLFSQVEHIKAGRTEEDLLFQVLLDWGVDLTLPIEKRVLNGKNVYFVDGNALVACFDKAIDEGIIQEIAKHQPLRSVFRDDGFVSDTAKINADQLFKQLAPHSELRVI
ncbi:site-specific DNA-methyltransferase [Actinobacillus equuli]|uniref:site-specific DNA-methyltransferase n=1 Tax=Actinobacillus equuli TaxID=718 RepID=UPI0024418F50|nr:site-specific DNA-methyltransferase [Actinobacillus equuli]WGE47333.1 site-specific DNA-methyltransferase [Actinobacillus equuli subsp. haemolyticus]